jgi:hypothetical protein
MKGTQTGTHTQIVIKLSYYSRNTSSISWLSTGNITAAETTSVFVDHHQLHAQHLNLAPNPVV